MNIIYFIELKFYHIILKLCITAGGNLKTTFIMVCLLLIVSCSSSSGMKPLSERIHAEEVRSLQEIKSNAHYLLSSHPELEHNVKEELTKLLDKTMLKHQALKDEESKILQLLLAKSIRINRLTSDDLKLKANLKKRLNEIYDMKLENILALSDKIVELTQQKKVNVRFEDDFIDLIRVFR